MTTVTLDNIKEIKNTDGSYNISFDIDTFLTTETIMDGIMSMVQAKFKESELTQVQVLEKQ